MAQRVFVNVVGFTDAERQALHSLWRLAEGRDTIYTPWEPQAPEAPQLALLDGRSEQARLEVDWVRKPDLAIIWVGAAAPPGAWRSFERPISWPEVVRAMDELFASPEEAVAFDIDFDRLDTRPPDTLPPDLPPRKRALIASADRDERLYLRARLSLADLTQADEAETAADALELARRNDYAVALVDFGLPGVDAWQLAKELGAGRRPIAKVIVTNSRASPGERVRAWFAGVAGVFDKPPHPAKLHALLLKV